MAASIRRIWQGLALLALSPLAWGQAFNVFQPGGDLAGSGSTWNNQVIAPAAVTYSKFQNVAADSFVGNPSGSSATAQDLNPIAAQNLLGATFNAIVECQTYSTTANLYGPPCNTSATGTIPSGPQTIDGISLTAGQTVLVNSVGTALGGLYTVTASGPWTRAVNFVGTIRQNCNIEILIQQGTLEAGSAWRLTTTGGAITIGTTNQVWTLVSPVKGSHTQLGSFLGTDASTNPTSNYVVQETGFPSGVNHCLSTAKDASGNLYGDISEATDVGEDFVGPCMLTDTYGHPDMVTSAAGGSVVLPTATSGTADSVASDSAATFSGVTVTAGSAWTVTYGAGTSFVNTVPHCVVTTDNATAVPYISTQPTAGSGTTPGGFAVKFSANLSSAHVTFICL